jgi:hypothetical protein
MELSRLPIRINALILCFALLTPSFTACASNQRELLGVKLRPALAAILDEVEHKLGKVDARFVQMKSKGTAKFGDSFIDDNGKPILLLSVDNDKSRNESIIAHELLHLRQRVRGYPFYGLDLNSSAPEMKTIDESRIIAGLAEAIEHWMFAPEMRKLNFNLDEEDKAGNDLLKETSAQNVNAALEMLLAIGYMRSELEFSNQSLLKETKEIFKSKGWTLEMERGAKMAKIVRQIKPQTPDDMTKAFLSCLDVITGSRFEYPTVSATISEYFKPPIYPTVFVLVTARH